MNVDLLLEAERRGILPPDKAALLAEARKRGLVTGEAPQAPAQKSIGQTIKENLLGDDDPTTQNTGERVGSAIHKGIEALTFGLVGDEANAAAESLLPGVNYEDRRDHYRQQEEVLERDNPGTALGAEVGGAVLGAVLPFGAIGTMGRGASLGQRVAASTAAGAGMGGVYGFTEGEGLEDRADQAKLGAGVGATVGALTPLVGGAVQKFADGRVANKAIRRAAQNAPTTEQLRAQGRALYGEVDNAGVSIRPDTVRSKTQEIARLLADEGADPDITPAATRVARRMSEAAEGANTVKFSELDRLRKVASNAALKDPANKADVRLSQMARQEIDDFISSLGPDDLDAGDIEALQTALPKARDVWARMSRSQLVDDAIENAADYRSGEASGLKAQFQRIVKNPKLKQGFSDAEMRAMRRVVNGTLPEQIVNYLGSGLGMMGQMATGAMIGGGLPGALMGGITAAGARKGSEALVRKNAEIARALVANGTLKNLPVASESGRQIIEALMRRGAAATVQ